MLEVKMEVDMEMPETCSGCDYEVVAGRKDEVSHKECMFTDEVLSEEDALKCRGKKCPLIQC